MKKSILALSLAALLPSGLQAQTGTPQSQMEPLSRGVVAVHQASGNFVSWRLLGTDAEDAVFTLVRDGKVIANGLTVSNYTDASGSADSKYQVITTVGGTPVDTSAATTPWADIYKSIKLSRPANGVEPDGTHYNYMPQECGAGDLNGDGDYEIIVKWLPSNQKDNSEDGYTGNCILDAYTLDGRQLWRVDLGCNIRSGSHYTQFLVYDFDGDGRAEMICKTAPGSIDGTGSYVSAAADDEAIKGTDNSADYRTAKGRIMTGPEYLTVFDGLTGRAIHTVWYNPNRGFTTGKAADYSDDWGDSYGNRGERYLAGVAYLDGSDHNPSAVMCRGYYTRSYLWAVDFDGHKLSTHWLHASISPSMYRVTDSEGKTTSTLCKSNTSGLSNDYTAYGQGNHQLAVADVDGDGCDEIVYGSATIDHDGSLLYTTGLGHGDALHVGDLMPDRPGLEAFQVHEHAPYGWDVHDAATGELLLHFTGTGDTGAGLAADIDLGHRGSEFWTSDNYNVYDTQGNVISSKESERPHYRWRIYWDGTATDNILDKTSLTDGKNKSIINFSNYGSSAQWGSKGYPCLSADLFGDWREEVIYFDKTDSCTLNIFTTTTATKLRVPTLMHDHVYRMGIAWQNTAYNMAPHLGYFLPDSVGGRISYDHSLQSQTVALGEPMQTVSGTVRHCTSLYAARTLIDGKVVKYSGVPNCLTFSFDAETMTFSLGGTPDKAGRYDIVLKTRGNVLGTELSDTLHVNVSDATGIGAIRNSQSTVHNPESAEYYDLAGRRLSPTAAQPSLVIVRRGGLAAKVVRR